VRGESEDRRRRRGGAVAPPVGRGRTGGWPVTSCGGVEARWVRKGRLEGAMGAGGQATRRGGEPPAGAGDGGGGGGGSAGGGRRCWRALVGYSSIFYIYSFNDFAKLYDCLKF
jgi:hypothetical protein